MLNWGVYLIIPICLVLYKWLWLLSYTRLCYCLLQVGGGVGEMSHTVFPRVGWAL